MLSIYIFCYSYYLINFTLLEDQYWAYSMANSSRGLISNDFPKHIEKLGLPHNLKIKATYVEEDAEGNQIKFYFFTDTRFVSFKSSEFKVNYFINCLNH